MAETVMMSTLERTRIDSWKAIAAFLRRDERTVQRWEKERALPVYRIPGERSRVFAYAEELTLWMERGAQIVENGVDTGEPEPPVAPVGDSATVEMTADVETVSGPATRKGRAWYWIGGPAVAVVLLAAAWPIVHRHNNGLGNVSEAAEPFGKPSMNSAAEAAFLHGRFLWNQRERGSLERALQFFRQAERLDPKFAAAYAGEAETYALMPEYAGMPAGQAFAAAKTAAQTAVGLDPASASAHRVLAFALLYGDWNADAALQEFDRAVRLDPRSAQTHHWYANALLALQRKDQAAAEMQKARELDPSSVALLTDQVLVDHGRGENVEESLRRLRELSQAQPNFLLPQQYAAIFLLESGQMDPWTDQVRKIADFTRSPQDQRLAQTALELQTAKASAELYLQALCQKRTDPLILRALGPGRMAGICLRANDPEGSAEMWRQAYITRDPVFLAFASSPEPASLARDAELARLRAAVHIERGGAFL